MKIKEANEDMILFDNGYKIQCESKAICCAWNYADFEQIDDIAMLYDFDEDIIFEAVDFYGFRFGDKRGMFFVPCYSEQNGYYSSEIEIIFNGKKVLNLECEDKIN